MANRKTIAQHVAVAASEHTRPAIPEDVQYPDSDGHFLPDNPLQAHAVVNLRFALHQHFEKVQNVVLEGDMFLYYEEGNPAASIAPDIYVVLDHDLGKRGVYKFWEEGKPPDFALEVISPSSKLRNSQDERALYARLGIGEYFLFQPDTEARGQRLVGYRLWARPTRSFRPSQTARCAARRLESRSAWRARTCGCAAWQRGRTIHGWRSIPDCRSRRSQG